MRDTLPPPHHRCPKRPPSRARPRTPGRRPCPDPLNRPSPPVRLFRRSRPWTSRRRFPNCRPSPVHRRSRCCLRLPNRRLFLRRPFLGSHLPCRPSKRPRSAWRRGSTASSDQMPATRVGWPSKSAHDLVEFCEGHAGSPRGSESDVHYFGFQESAAVRLLDLRGRRPAGSPRSRGPARRSHVRRARLCRACTMGH